MKAVEYKPAPYQWYVTMKYLSHDPTPRLVTVHLGNYTSMVQAMDQALHYQSLHPNVGDVACYYISLQHYDLS